MIKWPITYTDYNGETHTEDFYFNLNMAECMEMNLKANGAYPEYLKQIVANRDGERMAEVYRTLILKSYGEKSPDGRRFVKSKELSEAFQQTEAFPALYMQLMTEDGAAVKFITGVMPKIDVKNDATPNPENHMTLL